MAKQNTIVSRSHAEWVKFCEIVSIERVKNGLERKTLPKNEIERMTLNTESKNNLFKELTTKPRRTKMK